MKDKILETVLSKLDYEFLKDVLVKPLKEILVKKEITEQVPTGKKDEKGYEEYETKTEVKKVPSNFRTGIVLAIPACGVTGIAVGDTIVYNSRSAFPFDLFKDSQLVKPFDIVAKVKAAA